MPSRPVIDPKVKVRVKKNLGLAKKKSRSLPTLPDSIFDDDSSFDKLPSDQQKNQLPTEKASENLFS